VAAGILEASDGSVLIAERLGGGPFHGMWEFPGGKLSDDESADAALIRELSEEIGITALEIECFMHLQHDYPDRHVTITFFLVTAWDGAVAACEGQALRWVSPGDLVDANLLPADAPVIDALIERAAKR